MVTMALDAAAVEELKKIDPVDAEMQSLAMGVQDTACVKEVKVFSITAEMNKSFLLEVHQILGRYNQGQLSRRQIIRLNSILGALMRLHNDELDDERDKTEEEKAKESWENMIAFTSKYDGCYNLLWKIDNEGMSYFFNDYTDVTGVRWKEYERFVDGRTCICGHCKDSDDESSDHSESDNGVSDLSETESGSEESNESDGSIHISD